MPMNEDWDLDAQYEDRTALADDPYEDRWDRDPQGWVDADLDAERAEADEEDEDDEQEYADPCSYCHGFGCNMCQYTGWR